MVPTDFDVSTLQRTCFLSWPRCAAQVKTHLMLLYLMLVCYIQKENSLNFHLISSSPMQRSEASQSFNGSEEYDAKNCRSWTESSFHYSPQEVYA